MEITTGISAPPMGRVMKIPKSNPQPKNMAIQAGIESSGAARPAR